MRTEPKKKASGREALSQRTATRQPSRTHSESSAICHALSIVPIQRFYSPSRPALAVRSAPPRSGLESSVTPRLARVHPCLRELLVNPRPPPGRKPAAPQTTGTRPDPASHAAPRAVAATVAQPNRAGTAARLPARPPQLRRPLPAPPGRRTPPGRKPQRPAAALPAQPEDPHRDAAPASPPARLPGPSAPRPKTAPAPPRPPSPSARRCRSEAQSWSHRRRRPEPGSDSHEARSTRSRAPHPSPR